MPVMMDKIRHDKQKEVHASLDFGESPKKRRIREGSQNLSARTLSARYCNPSERLKVRDRLRYNDQHVIDRLGHRRQSAFDRLSDTYSPSTTKSGLDRANPMDRSHSRSRLHRRDSSNKDRPRSRDLSRDIEESYDNTHSSYGIRTKYGYLSCDRDRSRYVKRGRGSKSPLSRVSESGTSDGGHWKSKSKRHKPTDEDDLAVPWICEEVDPFTPRICNFKSSRKIRMPNNVKTYDGTGAARVWFDELPPESIDGYKDLKAAFLAYFMQQKKRMKGALEYMRISEFMHGVNNPELTKRLNEHVPKTMEEMMIAITTFIRGEAVAAGKKKGHASWRAQDQSKRHDSERRMKRQKVTQSFERVSEITFPSLTTSSGTEGPLVIEAEIGRHMIHRMYVDGDHSTKAWMNFMIVRSLSPYNGIIGRLGIREIQAVPSIAHEMLKFLVDRGITTIRSSNQRDAIRESTDGAMLTPEEKLGYICMAAVRRGMSTAINCRTSTQYPRRISTRSTEEKRLGPGACESHPSGVMVKKHDGSWRMCVDFTDLNKACPQDYYPLLEIDWKVESLCCYPFKCFLDAYKGYYQIYMVESNEEKIAFHTSHEVYCYTKMPFGLKNAGTTYQRLVDKAFDSQVGRNIEVYIDDLVIKSYTEAKMLRDINETFCTLRKINMKLNLKKCTFGAVEGMFLGYMISLEGIKPCPDKTEVVL
ncbi:reverse transcriptase domain-containing protein [Tanacetum coccineum]